MSWKEFFKQYKIAFIGSLGMVPVFLAIGLLLYFPDTEKTERGKVEQQTVGTKKEAENLSPFVKGMKDLYVEQNAKDVDWLKGVTYDKEKVKEVTADSKEVKLDKTGTYGLVYKITGKENAKEEKSVKVMVVDSKKSQELANSGKEVLLSGNELKKAEKPEGEKETSVASTKEGKASEDKKGEEKMEGQAASGSSSETTAGVQDNKSPSGGNVASGGNQQESGASGVQKPSVQVPEQPSKPEQKPSDTTGQKPAEPSRPAEPEKQWHEPVYENRWVVDREAWDEVIEEPVYEMVERCICNQCGADITGDPWGHLEQSAITGGNCGGYHSDWQKVQTGTTSHTVHHEEQGHYEQVLVKEGYWG